ncbi:MAG: hypothetical protein ACOVNZ_07470 [Crocinitomicaceae bacterium]
MKNNSILGTLLLLIACFSALAQSKKEQIEILSARLDSFNRVLDEEKKNVLSQSAELKNTTLRFQNKVDSLDKLLANTKQELKKTEKDLNDSKTELQAKEIELSKRTVQQKALEDQISELTNKNGQINTQLADANRELKGLVGRVKSLEDSIGKLSSNVQTLQSELQKTVLYPENNYDLLVSKFSNKDKNVQETEKWLKQLIKNNKEETGIPIDGDTSYMTLKAYKYVQDAMDFTWGYPGSIDEKTFKKKWGSQFDLKYSVILHLFEFGDCGWVSKKADKIEYLGEVNSGEWFRVKIIGGCAENDYSETVVRVVKKKKIGKYFAKEKVHGF